MVEKNKWRKNSFIRRRGILIRKLLEQRGIKLTEAEFIEVMKITTDDINFNRITFKKYTVLNYVLDIAVRSSNILKRF